MNWKLSRLLDSMACGQQLQAETSQNKQKINKIIF